MFSLTFKLFKFLRPKQFIVIFLISIFFINTPAFSGINDDDNAFTVQLELGPAWQSLNDVQIPNNQSGTRFSFVDLIGNGPFPAFRLYLTWQISRRHDLRLLAAPLKITESGTFDKPVSFEGRTYNPNQKVEGTYQFNSWRLTYRYRFYDGDNWRWWVGFTAKLRDAIVKLEQGGTHSEKTDLGFVPLLHLRSEYSFSDDWWLLFDFDGLAGGPGRAFDVTLQLGYNLSDHLSLSAGYRTVEGGADVDEVYNFAWFNYAVLSLNYNF